MFIEVTAGDIDIATKEEVRNTVLINLDNVVSIRQAPNGKASLLTNKQLVSTAIFYTTFDTYDDIRRAIQVLQGKPVSVEELCKLREVIPSNEAIFETASAPVDEVERFFGTDGEVKEDA